MGELRGKLFRALSDATIGTAIVMVHVLLADRDRVRGMSRGGTDFRVGRESRRVSVETARGGGQHG